MRKTLLAVATAAALAPCAALATDGYFAHGYGMKAKGRAGASTAMATDAFGGAVNPATMAFAGERLDLGLDWFRPDRSAKREGSAGGTGFLDGAAEGNETENFFIPEFGYNRMVRPDLSLGITVYGNGGISVRKQIIIAMTISGGLAGMVGISEVLGYRHRYYDGFSDNYGFTGIAVALLGRNHPVGVILAALLFAILQRGGIPVDAFTESVTKDIVQVLQGTIILFVAAEAFFRGPFAKWGLLKRGKV